VCVCVCVCVCVRVCVNMQRALSQPWQAIGGHCTNACWAAGGQHEDALENLWQDVDSEHWLARMTVNVSMQVRLRARCNHSGHE
jgi:hypothetical protein